MPTIEDLGKQIKAKYPGSYDDVSDADLGLKIREKYPQYSDYGTPNPDSGDQPATFTGTLKALGRQLPDNLPALGGIVGSIGGPTGSIGGASAGSMIKQGLKNLAPSIFGESEGVGGVAKDTLFQGVAPEVAGGSIGIIAKALKSGIIPAIAESLGSLGSKLPGTKAAQVINKAKSMLISEAAGVETAGQNVRDNIKPYPVTTTSDVLDQYGNKIQTTSMSKSMPDNYKGTVAQDLYKTPYNQINVANIPPLGKTADTLFSDISEVRNAKIASNPTVVRQLAQDRILRKNWAGDSFNPSKVLDELTQSEDIYKEALGKSYDSFKDLMTTAKELKVGEHPDSLFNWQEIRKAGILSVPLSFFGIPNQVGGMIVIGVDAMRKIAADPQIGQLIIAGMKTPKSSPAADILSKAIANSLRGTTLFLQTDEGREEVKVGENGTLQTPTRSR